MRSGGGLPAISVEEAGDGCGGGSGGGGGSGLPAAGGRFWVGGSVGSYFSGSDGGAISAHRRRKDGRDLWWH